MYQCAKVQIISYFIVCFSQKNAEKSQTQLFLPFFLKKSAQKICQFQKWQ